MKVKQIQLDEQDFAVIEVLILKDFESKLRLEDDQFSFSMDNQVSLHNLSGESVKFENPFNLNLSVEFEFSGTLDGEDYCVYYNQDMTLHIINDDEGVNMEYTYGNRLYLKADKLYENMCKNIEHELKEILFG